MNLYFDGEYRNICTGMLRLGETVLSEISQIKVKDKVLEEIKLTVAFWQVFNSAATNNTRKAIEVLKQISEKTEIEVKKVIFLKLFTLITKIFLFLAT